MLTDLPPGIAPAAADAKLSAADRSFVIVMPRVLGPQGLQSWADMLKNLPADPAASDFDDLQADAGESTRQAVAEPLAPYARALHAQHPDMRNAEADAARGSRFAEQTAATAINDNPAQLDVLRRLQSLLRGSRRTDRT